VSALSLISSLSPLSVASSSFFFFQSSATPRHLHSFPTRRSSDLARRAVDGLATVVGVDDLLTRDVGDEGDLVEPGLVGDVERLGDRKSTRLNSSHVSISYAVFCLKKKIRQNQHLRLQTPVLVYVQ